MKIKILYCAIISLLIPFNIVSAQTDETLLVEFEKELMDKSVDIQTIVCDFVQTRSMSVLAEDAVEKGRFYYSRPENILLSFADGDYIKMTESVFQMKDKGSVSEMKVSSNPMLSSLSRLLSSCMTGDIKQMTKGFKMDVSLEDGKYIVNLVPSRKGSAARMGKMVLAFDRKDMSLCLLKMEENSGDYTQYEFFNKEFNSVLESDLF